MTQAVSTASNCSHFHPYTRLPRELQAEIFVLSLPKSRLPTFAWYDLPAVLLQVSRSWRNLALATPRLWNRFELFFRDQAEARNSNVDRLLSIVALWLKRSGDLPLSVTLSYPAPFSAARRNFNEAAPAVLQRLLEHNSRWESITLKVPGMALTPLIATSSPHLEFGKLKALTLDLQGDWCAPSFDIQTIGINWDQLQVLHLALETGNILTLDQCWDILARASSLTECSLNALHRFQRSCRANELVLPLKSLQLTLQGNATSPATSLITFLNSLELPLLSELRIRWLLQESVAWSPICQEAFVDFLTQLQSSIETLQLAYFPITERQLLDILHSVPFLTALSLRFPLASTMNEPITKSFFQALGSRNPKLLPWLKSLHIECPGKSWSRHELTSALLPRLHSGLKLSAHVSEVPDDIQNMFDSWLLQGLDVQMRYLEIR